MVFTMTLTQHTLKPRKGSTRPKKRLGRGDAFAGRGVKGQLKRVGKGKALRAGFEGGQIPLVRRLPKLGGFRNVNRIEYQAVNVKDISGFTEPVTPESLKASGLIRSSKKPVKVLAVGDISTKVAVKAHAISAAAKEKIEKAGGSVELISPKSVARQKGEASAKERAEKRAARKK